MTVGSSYRDRGSKKEGFERSGFHCMTVVKMQL